MSSLAMSPLTPSIISHFSAFEGPSSPLSAPNTPSPRTGFSFSASKGLEFLKSRQTPRNTSSVFCKPPLPPKSEPVEVEFEFDDLPDEILFATAEDLAKGKVVANTTSKEKVATSQDKASDRPFELIFIPLGEDEKIEKLEKAIENTKKLAMTFLKDQKKLIKQNLEFQLEKEKLIEENQPSYTSSPLDRDRIVAANLKALQTQSQLDNNQISFNHFLHNRYADGTPIQKKRWAYVSPSKPFEKTLAARRPEFLKKVAQRQRDSQIKVQLVIENLF